MPKTFYSIFLAAKVASMFLSVSFYLTALSIIAAFTTMIQGLTIYIMLKYSPKNIHRYRPYLVLTTIYELIYAVTVGFLIQGSPTGPVNNPEIMVTGLLSLLFKREGAMIGMILLGSGIGLIAIGQTVCLLYRFLVFHTKYQKAFHFMFSKRTIKILHILLYVSVALLGIFGANKLTLTTQTTSYGVTNVCLDSNPNDIDTTRLIISVLSLLVLWELFYLYISMRIVQLAKLKISTLSPNTIRLHGQLSYLILARAICLFICFLVPIVLTIMDLVITGEYFGYIRIQSFFFMSLIQMAVNSALTIGFIRPFRSRFKKMVITGFICSRIRCRQNQATSTVASVSNNTQSRMI